MKRIEMPKGTTYLQAKEYASLLMKSTPAISSVRVMVTKDLEKVYIEITEYLPKVLDKLVKM